MIYADFLRRNGNYLGFKVSGHAGYEDIGKDIACASVTSAVQLTANTITDFLKIGSEVSAENNVVSLKITDYCDNDSCGFKVIESLKFHLELISQVFEGTIRIKVTEV
jgi:uncharacterized protein YsxB (DUF464 family)